MRHQLLDLMHVLHRPVEVAGGSGQRQGQEYRWLILDQWVRLRLVADHVLTCALRSDFDWQRGLLLCCSTLSTDPS